MNAAESSADTASQEHAPVRVWDLPTRLFHWALASCVILAFITGQIGEGALAWHFRFGYAVFALVVFRVVWGLVGGRWSRFVAFVRGPSTILRYLRGDHRHDDHFEAGHNPLGSLSVLALLLWLTMQVATGLVADDEVATTGPLNKFVVSATALSATSWHKTGGQWGLVALVVLHVGAILFYLHRKGVNLVHPMLHGDKHLPPHTPPSRDDAVTRGAALAIAAASAALVAYIVTLGG